MDSSQGNAARSATAVVIVAAGSGQRLGHGIPKARVPLAGQPILAHALRGVIAANVAAQIYVCVPVGDSQLREICAAEEQLNDGHPVVIHTVHGGASRAESVANALRALEPSIERVLIHDAARPLVPVEVFTRVCQALDGGAPAVIPVISVVDTIKSVEPVLLGGAEAYRVTGTPARDTLRAVQTPQGFSLHALREAHSAVPAQDDITDDAMLMERAGVDVYVVPGSEYSHKITSASDLLLAEAWLEGPLAPRWVEG